jgi:hypothetical protein
MRETVRVVGRLEREAIDPAAEALLLHAFRDRQAG